MMLVMQALRHALFLYIVIYCLVELLHFLLLMELNMLYILFIGSGQGPFVTLEQNGLWQSL